MATFFFRAMAPGMIHRRDAETPRKQELVSALSAPSAPRPRDGAAAAGFAAAFPCFSSLRLCASAVNNPPEVHP